MKCPTCNFHIRGDKHAEGQHHKRDSKVVTGAALSRRTKRANDHGRKTNVGDPKK